MPPTPKVADEEEEKDDEEIREDTLSKEESDETAEMISETVEDDQEGFSKDVEENTDGVEEKGEPDEELIELDEEDFGFDEVEDATATKDEEEESREKEEKADSGGGKGSDVAEAINDGASTLAVFGLDEDDGREGLKNEFREVFESFKLGYFAEKTLDEYGFFDGDEEMNPAVGLIGSSLICSAVVISQRPDGAEIKDDITDTLGGIADMTDSDSNNGGSL